MRDMILSSAKEMGIPLTEKAASQLVCFHQMLSEANRVMNLTRVSDDPREAVDRNDLDSLAPLAVPHLLDDVHTMIDVGSGAGFPGIPLAIACPHIHVVLLDALGKRVRFLNQVIAEMHLNAEAVHMRAEDAASLPAFRDHFDLVTARAVAALPTLIEWALPFARVGGCMIAYKGPSLDEEMSASSAALRALCGRTLASHRVDIPGREWDHRLVIIQKTAPTPRAFPRKAGEASRNPLH